MKTIATFTLLFICLAVNCSAPPDEPRPEAGKSPHSEALMLILTTQQETIRKVDQEDWWHDAKQREWTVKRLFPPGYSDSTHLFEASYRIDSTIVASWLVDTKKSTAELQKQAEPSSTLSVKLTEHPEVLVNADPVKTGLRIAVVTPTEGLKVWQECEVRVEIHNEGHRIEIVYTPALTLLPVLVGDSGKGGHLPAFAGLATRDERLNYLVLGCGESYARTSRWTPHDTGQVTFQAEYRNKKNGEEIGVKAWTGELRSRSKALRISKQ